MGRGSPRLRKTAALACGASMAAAACVPRGALPSQQVAWVELALTASGGSELEGTYHHHTEPGSSGTWQVVTDRTEGVVRAARSPALAFDSAAPSPADPWPLLLQHAIAAVPAQVEMDRQGRPLQLVDPEAWGLAARQAIAEVDVPPGTGEALIDPDGFVVNLARTFPGRPRARSTWVRQERIAGLLATRTETCGGIDRVDGERHLRCEGPCTAAADAPGDLFDTVCWTELWWDRHGLRKVESGYSGTLITLGDGPEPIDLPIAGQRLLVRKR